MRVGGDAWGSTTRAGRVGRREVMIPEIRVVMVGSIPVSVELEACA